MPRTLRASEGGYCYHVLNRGNRRAEVFHKDGDYAAFLGMVAEASIRLPLPVLAYCLKEYLDDPADALRAYEGARRLRTARAQQVSHKQGKIYGRSGPEALIRNLGMKLMGGEKLRTHYDWIYSWRPPEETGSLAS